MALPVKTRPLTPEEYLRIEREAPFKSEYYDGEMFAMAGGSFNQSLIAANIGGILHALLRGHRCKGYQSDLRIAVLNDGLYTYPDFSVFCEPLVPAPGTGDTATNPTVIVEILSKSTEAYDRGRKFQAYRQLPSLREYLLVSQDSPSIERFTREGEDRWVLTVARGLNAVLPVEAVEVEIPLVEVYDGVDFTAQEDTFRTPEGTK